MRSAQQITQGRRALRVAMALPYYPPRFGGAGLQAQRLAGRLARAGVGITVLTSTSEGHAGTEREEGLTVRRFRTPPRRTRREKLVFGLRVAGWLLVQRDWDLLHVHAFGSWSVLPALVAHALGRPVLAKTTLSSDDDLTSLGAGRRGPGRLLSRAVLASYRRCDAVVALSSEIETGLSDGGFRGEIARIPNGVDTDLFHPAGEAERTDSRAAFGLPPQAFVVVTVGALMARKNMVGLLDAASRCPQRPIVLALAGPTELFPEYRKQVEDRANRLPDGVDARLLGELEPQQLARLYRAADVFVLNSLEEGMPNSLLEAMASGLPAIATDVSGSRDLLTHGGGLKVPPGDVTALTEAISRLAADADLRTRLGAEGRRAVEGEYALRRVAGRYLELYARLLGRS